MELLAHRLYAFSALLDIAHLFSKVFTILIYYSFYFVSSPTLGIIKLVNLSTLGYELIYIILISNLRILVLNEVEPPHHHFHAYWRSCFLFSEVQFYVISDFSIDFSISRVFVPFNALCAFLKYCGLLSLSVICAVHAFLL